MSKKHIRFIIGALLLIYLFVAPLTSMRWSLSQPPGYFYTGMLQSDQVTYTAIFRSVITRGTGFTYSYPYAPPGPDNPAVNFQLPFTLLAWMWKLAGKNVVAAWEILRFLSAAAFFVVLYLFSRDLFKNFYEEEDGGTVSPWYLIVFFVALAFGGGIAWFFGGLKYLSELFSGDAAPDFLSVFFQTEKAYHWWFLNIFRNLFYPLETFYHVFFFLGLWGLVKKNNKLVFVSQILACLSGVFIGVELSAILLVFLFTEMLISKAWPEILRFLFSLGIFLVFASYYAFLLPMFRVPAVLAEQHKQTLYDLIPLHRYLPAYGIFLVLALLSLMNSGFRKKLFFSRTGRLVLIWVLVTGFLVLNHLFLPGKGFQPPHFTRGYLFAALVAISAIGFFPAWKKLRQSNPRKSLIILIVILVLSLPDNILFLAERVTVPPHRDVLMIRTDSKKALEFLEQLPGEETVFCTNYKFGYLIPAFSGHSSVFVEHYAMVNYGEIIVGIAEFSQNRNVEEFIEKYKITVIIMPRENGVARYFDQNIKRQEWNILFENDLWKVYDCYSNVKDVNN